MNIIMQKNRLKTYVVIGILLAIFAGIGQWAGDYYYDDPLQGLLMSVVIFFVYLGISLFSAQAFVLSLAKAKRIEETGEYADLFRICKKLAQANDLPLPKLYIVEDQTANAFACGISPKWSAVAVHRGLLNRLNNNEIEAVLAHEFTHIKNLDVRVSTIVAALMSALIVILRLFGNSRRQSKGKGSGIMLIVYVVAYICFSFFSVFIQAFVSRKREYMADAGSVMTLKNGRYLISALEKISGQEHSEEADKSMEAFYFASPFKSNLHGDNLLSTHPSLENRIKAIRESENQLYQG